MDARHAFVGDHSPVIALSQGEPRGIRQALLPLIKGKDYAGHIFLAGDPATRVSVSLAWGNGAADRQTLTIGKLTSTFNRLPLTFKCPVDSTEGRIEITATVAVGQEPGVMIEEQALEEYGDVCRPGLLLHTGERVEWITPRILACPWWRVL